MSKWTFVALADGGAWYNLAVRRLRRWMFNAAASVSLVLCVAMVPIWVRSYGWFED
jgi:hypothetical protein